jgi:alpha-beta hydrolase superfamily lysophospholipase
MLVVVKKLLMRLAILLAGGLLAVLLLRAWDSRGGPDLQPWHTHVPKELTPAQMDATDWAGYLAHEQALTDELRDYLRRKMPASGRVVSNRYFEGAPMYPGRFAQDWNRSYRLLPEGPPRGAAVLLHGLTDSPYSMRHLSQRYARNGFVAVVIRLPGHGTVPAGLTAADGRDWLAATRLAVREARRASGPDVPLHIVGYSNGGALAMKYSLDALEDPTLARPDRIVLISPMIGVTRFARFAGVAGWPALFPAFAKSAWLGLVPEFNPFKYNSFPVRAARQSHLVSQHLQRQLLRLKDSGQLDSLAPVLTFQSVLDTTVSTPAVLSALYAQLPANGSEVVLFDVNRGLRFNSLLNPGAETALSQLLPPGPQRYRTTVIANEAQGSARMVERSTQAGSIVERTRPLDLTYPTSVFSLSHIALPFPVTDGVNGLTPDPADDFGVTLGTVAPRGERAALSVGLDLLLRLSSNPFFPYLLERTDDLTGAPEPVAAPVDAP